MSLSAGARIGPYEIVSLIGAGGMGEVYRARDERLNRVVAIKVLPDAFACDGDRLARFKREAQLLASLNHPNIAAIYGFEETSVVGAGFSRPIHALVLEFVDGPTLAGRLATGPLPVEEALPVARQIAEALEAAHEIGIVHRDLKPANIKVSEEGAVKVLDFGLAKALEGDVTSPEMSQSPTLTVAATGMGVILGTAAYMAPEQARGKAVDRRADIWAFGCVLYEMLTARRAFEAAEVSDTLAAVLRGEPDWSALPPATPGSIRRLLRRCLQKDRRSRLQAIGDARIEIIDALAGHEDGMPDIAAAPRSSMRRVAPVAAAAIVSGVLGATLVWRLQPSASDTQPLVTRTLLAVRPFDRRPPPPAGETTPPAARPDRTALALSPDGRILVFRALNVAGVAQLFARGLDRLEPTALAGTEQSDTPFFSPDGQWLGFWAAGELRKVPVAGGVATTVTRVPGAGSAPRIFGASWGTGDVIVFATDTGLWSVAASGGEPVSLSAPRENEYRHTLPHMLPGRRQVLFTVTRTPFEWADAQIVVRSLDTGEQKVLVEDGADARYVPSGHIVFIRQGVLMAAAFDLATLEIAGGRQGLSKASCRRLIWQARTSTPARRRSLFQRTHSCMPLAESPPILRPR
jgi:serine/threonine-protein kinase